jgi:hypothetical protein
MLMKDPPVRTRTAGASGCAKRKAGPKTNGQKVMRLPTILVGNAERKEFFRVPVVEVTCAGA